MIYKGAPTRKRHNSLLPSILNCMCWRIQICWSRFCSTCWRMPSSMAKRVARFRFMQDKMVMNKSASAFLMMGQGFRLNRWDAFLNGSFALTKHDHVLREEPDLDCPSSNTFPKPWGD